MNAFFFRSLDNYGHLAIWRTICNSKIKLPIFSHSLFGIINIIWFRNSFLFDLIKFYCFFLSLARNVKKWLMEYCDILTKNTKTQTPTNWQNKWNVGHNNSSKWKINICKYQKSHALAFCYRILSSIICLWNVFLNVIQLRWFTFLYINAISVVLSIPHF